MLPKIGDRPRSWMCAIQIDRRHPSAKARLPHKTLELFKSLVREACEKSVSHRRVAQDKLCGQPGDATPPAPNLR